MKLGTNLLIVIGLLVIAGLIVLIPQFQAMHELYYGSDKWYELLSNRINLPSNWSRVAAPMLSFLTAVVWAPIFWGIFHLWRRKRNPAKILSLAFCWFVVYATSPFLLATLGSNVCFAKDGTTDKWYVETADHQIVLYDSGGFDAYGNRKIKATPDICARYALQRSGNTPTRVTYAPGMQFFSGSGSTLVWFYRAPDGTIELYDKGGYHPTVGEKLSPITRDIVQEVQRQAAARAKTEITNAKIQAAQAEREKIKVSIDVVRSGGGASFDCLKAKTAIELTICTDETLAEQDRILGQAYGALLGRTTFAEQQRLIDAERRWVNARNVECAYRGQFLLDSPETDITRKCLLQSINAQIAGLQGPTVPVSQEQKEVADIKPLGTTDVNGNGGEPPMTGSAYAQPSRFPPPFNFSIRIGPSSQ